MSISVYLPFSSHAAEDKGYEFYKEKVQQKLNEILDTEDLTEFKASNFNWKHLLTVLTVMDNSLRFGQSLAHNVHQTALAFQIEQNSHMTNTSCLEERTFKMALEAYCDPYRLRI